MIQQELFNRIRNIGVKSGVIEICYSGDIRQVIGFSFDAGYTGFSYDSYLDSIELGEFCVKNDDEATKVEQLLIEKGKKMEPELIARANELAEEIRKRAGIPVKVIPRLQGKPKVWTEFDLNMWHADQVLTGIDPDW